VSSIYGEGEVSDKLIMDKERYDYKFKKGDDYWSDTLKEGDRELYAVWDILQKDANMKDDLILIKLWTRCDRYIGDYTGTLLIDYCFMNMFQVENKEDDVL